MEQGLAHSYVNTESQNTTKHHYAKPLPNKKRKKCKKLHKARKKL